MDFATKKIIVYKNYLVFDGFSKLFPRDISVYIRRILYDVLRLKKLRSLPTTILKSDGFGSTIIYDGFVYATDFSLQDDEKIKSVTHSHNIVITNFNVDYFKFYYTAYITSPLSGMIQSFYFEVISDNDCYIEDKKGNYKILIKIVL